MSQNNNKNETKSESIDLVTEENEKINEKNNASIRKEKRRRNRIIVSVTLLLLSIVIVILLREWIGINPFKPVILENVYSGAADKEGNLYIIDDANSRLLKVDPEGKLIWKVKGSGTTFESADNIVCDDEGNIYIHDVRILSGVRIASESIIKFSSDGKYIGEIKKWDYSSKRQKAKDRMRSCVAGMTGKEHSVTYMLKSGNTLYAVDEELNDVKSYSFPDVENKVLSCAYDNDRLWYTTYDGRLYEYFDGENDNLLYDCDDNAGSIIRNISFGDGRLYVTDIGKRDILVIDVSDGEQSRLSFEENINEREITYNVEARNRLVSASSYSVSVWNGEDYDRYYEVELSTKWKILTFLLAISILDLLINAVIDVILFAYFIIRKSNLYARVILAIIAGVIAMGVLFFGSTYPQFQQQLTEAVFSRENLAATVTAEKLPKDAFIRLSKPSDYMNDDYMDVKGVVDEIFMSNTEDARDLYCSMYRVIDGTITLTYSMENVGVVYPYDWDYEGSDEQGIIETGAGKTYVSTSTTGSYIFVLQPIFGDDGSVIGLIEVGKDLGGFLSENQSMITALIINIIVMTMVIIMLVIELFYYIAGKRELGEADVAEADVGYAVTDAGGKETGEKTDKAPRTTPAGILRFLTFLICFFTNLATAILPIYAMRIAGRGATFRLSREVLSAIPISAEVISCAVCSFLGNRILKKLGGKKTAFISSILLTAGLTLRMIPNIWALTLAQIIFGAGWGTLILMINILITALPEDERDKGFAYFSGAGFSGANCGILFGGFLIQWVSHSTLFLISAVLSIVLIFITKRYLANTNAEEEGQEEEAKNIPAYKLIFNPHILVFVFMMLIPAAIVGYYLNYMYPILGEEWGLSETYIGYSYLIDAVFVLAFGGLLTKLFSKRKRLGVAISSIVYAMAFVVVIVFKNIPALFGSLALVGLSDGFGNPLMTGYFTDLPEVEEYGYDRAFGIYSIFENIAQSVGSFVFSYVLIMGVGKGLTILAVSLCVLSLIFLFGGVFDRRGY